MIVDVDGLSVLFPYEYMYPEQYAYMTELKRALDSGGHALLEMPSGTGKTVTLLSLIVAYQLKYPSRIGKLMYCSRTLPELQKAVEELRRLYAYYKQNDSKQSCDLIGLCLTSRSNLCVHPQVSAERDPRAVDGRCHAMASNYRRRQSANSKKSSNGVRRNRDAEDEDIEDEDDEEMEDEENRQAVANHAQVADLEDTCSYFTNFDQAGRDCMLQSGIYSLDDLKDFGRKNNLCPYFVARHALSYANVVVYSYAYLLQPKVADVVSAELPRNTCVVFDEAHNIDGVCIEALSVTMNRKALDRCSTALARLKSEVQRMRQADEAKLRAEYDNLVTGLRNSVHADADQEPILANPLLPDDVLQDAMPGSIRSAEHFLSFLNRFSEYVKMRMRTADRPIEQSAVNFLKDVCTQALIARKALRYSSERLRSLLTTLEQSNVHSATFSSGSGEQSALARLADFATLLGTYVRGFTVLIEPQDDRAPLPTGNAPLANPLLTFACLDASLAIKPVFSRFSSVVITSGTLSPLDMYPKMLDFRPVVSASFTMTLARPCICPLIIGKGNDQVTLTSKFESRHDPSVLRNYGALLLELGRVVPDGMVAFFPSYAYLESAVAAWYEQGILDQLLSHKLLFIETPDAQQTSVALTNFRQACDSGRGAVLLSVARGRVSEGVDFSHHYGRCVIVFGVPYVYTQSRRLLARLRYLRDMCDVKEQEFLSFDALRHAAQCAGRALRAKTDYGIMCFADRRYARSDKKDKLPKWIGEHLTDSLCNLSIEEGVQLSKRFLRQMAQPFSRSDQLGVSLMNAEQMQDANVRQRLCTLAHCT